MQKNNFNYPAERGRSLLIGQESSFTENETVVLIGDSTIDNIHWAEKTVTDAVAIALSNQRDDRTQHLINLSVDGATSGDLLDTYGIRLNKVVKSSKDHPNKFVHPLDTTTSLKPSTVVLSVGGNDYREALQETLAREVPYLKLLMRTTPETAKKKINAAFFNVKEQLKKNYKEIIDRILKNNHKSLKRLVLVSQYYPALTMLTPYFIYTGFSHVAAAQRKGLTGMEAVSATMEELYREILVHAKVETDKMGMDLIFVDMTSALSPLGGNHSWQIEPNNAGSSIMGKMIAEGVTHDLSESKTGDVAVLRKNRHGKVELVPTLPAEFKVKPLEQWIKDNRYQHLIPSRNTNFATRLENTYYFFAGNHFDAQYTGRFALGLIDISVITLIAAYLWRHAISTNGFFITRMGATAISAPILTARFITGASCTFCVSPLVYIFHKLAQTSHCLDNFISQYTRCCMRTDEPFKPIKQLQTFFPSERRKENMEKSPLYQKENELNDRYSVLN